MFQPVTRFCPNANVRTATHWHKPCNGILLSKKLLNMKKIEAIVQPARLRDVKKALIETGLSRMTVMEVKAFGRDKGHIQIYRGAECFVDFLQSFKIEVVVPDEKAIQVVEAISMAGNDIKNGDAEILVYTLDPIPRVRTEALSAVAA